MTLYLLSVWHKGDFPQLPEEEMQAMFDSVDAFNRTLDASGRFVFGGGLHPIDTATVVDGSTGDAVVTDGPFAEAKEQMGGFWVVRCEDLDEALKVATDASIACKGAVEVRPFADGGTSAEFGG